MPSRRDSLWNLTTPDVLALWQQYAQTRDVGVRNRLVEVYLPLVQPIAFRIFGRLPREVRLDELESAGHVGLIAAVEAYNPAKGTTPEGYVTLRVRGAVIDELRSLDPVSRPVRSLVKMRDAAAATMAVETGQPPTLSEIADRTGVPLARLAKLERMPLCCPVFSLHEVIVDDLVVVDVIAQDTEPDPSARVTGEDTWTYLMGMATDGGRFVLERTIAQGQLCQDVAKELGLCPSAASTTRSYTFARIREQLDKTPQERDALAA